MQRRILITCIVALAVVIAIAVGVAVPLSHRSKGNDGNGSQSVNAPVITQSTSNPPTDSPQVFAKTAILLPLYIYPTKTSWDPIYSALSAHANVAFTVVINPNSGPGPSPAPDSPYASAISRLKSYKNADVVGYLDTAYGERSINAVYKDISAYKTWDPAYRPGGCFFDQTPSSEHVDYLKNATSEVKKVLGGTVVHNPGVIPSEEILKVGQDITIVVENTEEGYKMDEKSGAYSEGIDRAKSAAILHTCTSDPNKLVPELENYFGYVFVSELKGNDAYSNFGKDWDDMVSRLAKDNDR